MHIAPHRRQRQPQVHINTENHLHQLGDILHTDVWVPHKVSKAFLTIFLHVILCSTHNAPFLGVMGVLSRFIVEQRSDAVGPLGWTITEHQGQSHPEGGVLHEVGLEGVLCSEAFRKPTIIQTAQSQLNQLGFST